MKVNVLGGDCLLGKSFNPSYPGNSIAGYARSIKSRRRITPLSGDDSSITLPSYLTAPPPVTPYVGPLSPNAVYNAPMTSPTTKQTTISSSYISTAPTVNKKASNGFWSSLESSIMNVANSPAGVAVITSSLSKPVVNVITSDTSDSAANNMPLIIIGGAIALGVVFMFATKKPRSSYTAKPIVS